MHCEGGTADSDNLIRGRDTSLQGMETYYTEEYGGEIAECEEPNFGIPHAIVLMTKFVVATRDRLRAP